MTTSYFTFIHALVLHESSPWHYIVSSKIILHFNSKIISPELYSCTVSINNYHITASLQIIFDSKQVICPVRDKFSPDKKPVWSDKTCFSITCLRQLQWNLDLTKSLGTGQICSLNGGFVISRFFSMHFTVTLVGT